MFLEGPACSLQVRDLLSPDLHKLKVVDHAIKGTAVVSDQGDKSHQAEHFITTLSEVSKMLTLALASRSTACTLMNATSSRSHAVVRLTVESRMCGEGEKGGLVPLKDVFNELLKARK
jgi:hypothetical protein